MPSLRQALGLAVGLALTATPAEAQVAGRFRALVGGGSTIALGDFGDFFDNGPHGTIGVEIAPAGLPIGIRVDGTYHRVSGDDEALAAAADLPGLTFDDFDSRIVGGTVSAVYRFSGSALARLRPYLVGGVGLYNHKFTGEDAEGVDQASTDVGIAAGAGFDVGIGESLGIFAEGRFHNVFGDSDDPTFGDSSDIRFLTLSLGARVGR